MFLDFLDGLLYYLIIFFNSSIVLSGASVLNT